MATKLIELDGDILVEAEVPFNEAREISGNAIDRVGQSLETIHPLLVKVCTSLKSVWTEMNKEMSIDQAEVELGLSFTGEGNLYITKASAGANLKVKIVMKPALDAQ